MAVPTNYDFSGYATRNDIKCSDGRTIRRDAFKDCDGKVVPLVWNHQHNESYNVLGHALLENRDDGVYTYGSFNDTESGETARKLVQHGDIVALSIYANKLKQNGGDVLHGQIREVSLVLAGANTGAYIDTVMAHGDDSEEEGVIYFYGENDKIELSHAEDDKSEEKEEPEMAEEKEKTIGEIVESMNEDQKKALAILIAEAAENGIDDDEDDEEAEHSDYEEEEDEMKHNVFDQEEMQQDNILTHSDMEQIIKDAKRTGSLKEAFEAYTNGGALMHATEYSPGTATYGVDGVDWLFPEAKNMNMPPEFIKRDMEWVSTVMNGAHHVGFSRIKSMYADITEDDARALGYVKGNLKKEEVFGLLRRSTTPQTVYKKQKMDRDDIIDITDFDVVAWLKGEMRMMLNEEIARAILISDGRSSLSTDKISEDHIRPIYNDEDLFTIKYAVTVGANATDDDLAKAMIRGAVKARIQYKGSGNPTLFTTEAQLTDMLLLEDGIGHKMYKTEQELATALRVSKIVTVPVMEGLKISFGSGASAVSNADVLGVIVNMRDYAIGADKGGAVNMFEDFDIDYNQEKYLIETRCSGALVKPYSAITLYKAVSA